MRINTTPFGRLLFTALMSAGVLWSSPVLILDPPSGNLAGPPGSTVGWGFTITNDANYIEIISAQFCVGAVNFPLICNSPVTGTFNDFITADNDIIVGPPMGTDPDTVTQAFDALAMTGIGSFTIDPGALVGDSDFGEIVLTYRVTDLDPRNPLAKVIDTDVVLAADASVTVSAALATPEPAAAIFMALGLVALLSWSLRGTSRRGLLS